MRVIWFVLFVLWTGSASAAYNDPVACVQFPALTGDTTTTAGSCTTTDILHKISTQTASAAASIQWTGLATYNEYQLICHGVFTSGGAGVKMQFGEGGTPTWQTSSYKWADRYLGSDAVAGDEASASDAGIQISSSTGTAVASPVVIGGTFYGIATSGATKSLVHNSNIYNGGVSYALIGSGVFTGDTNVITALRLLPNSGTISGTCSLYGYSQ